MHRRIERDQDEKRPRQNGGKTWQDIANELDVEIDALKEERHVLHTAIRTMSQDVVRKADEVLQIDKRYNELKARYDRLRLQHEGPDVHAEVEEEEAEEA